MVKEDYLQENIKLKVCNNITKSQNNTFIKTVSRVSQVNKLMLTEEFLTFTKKSSKVALSSRPDSFFTTKIGILKFWNVRLKFRKSLDYCYWNTSPRMKKVLSKVVQITKRKKRKIHASSCKLSIFWIHSRSL